MGSQRQDIKLYDCTCCDSGCYKIVCSCRGAHSQDYRSDHSKDQGKEKLPVSQSDKACAHLEAKPREGYDSNDYSCHTACNCHRDDVPGSCTHYINHIFYVEGRTPSFCKVHQRHSKTDYKTAYNSHECGKHGSLPGAQEVDDYKKRKQHVASA